MLLDEAETGLVEDLHCSYVLLYGSTPFNQMSIMTTSDIRREAPTNKMIVSIIAIRTYCGTSCRDRISSSVTRREK
jgi:hypothetical protein